MTRRLLALLTTVTVLAVPAGASAADKTLLSGYGGPGGGEQSKLGGTLLPAPRGNGSLRAPTPGPGPGPQAGGAASTTPAPASGGLTAGGSGGGESSTGRPGSGAAAVTAGAVRRGTRGPKPARAERRGSKKAPGAATPAARKSVPPAGERATTPAQPVAYPAENEASALPLGGSDAVLLVFGLAALGLAGTAMWGLARTPARRPGSQLR